MGRDSSGESLEAILASIRRSLAEQATDVLEEEAVVPPEAAAPSDASGDLDAPPFPQSLSQQLAATPEALRTPSILNGEAPAGPPAGAPPGLAGSGMPSPAPAAGVEPGLAATAAAPAVVAPPSVTATPAAAGATAPAHEPGQEQKDPLWFLGQEPGQRAAAPASGGASRQKTVPGSTGGMAPAPEPRPVRAADPKPSRIGVLRGPLPPFFGSSAEAVKVEIAPDPPALSSMGGAAARALEPAPVAPPQPVGSPLGTDSRDVPQNGGADGDRLEGPKGWPRAADDAVTGKASSIFGPSPAEARTGTGEASPQIQALEAMVADLLRPMLRRWLDENMPRLVSAALKAEAELMSKRDPKKP